MNEITAFELYNFLPNKIQELLFSQYMDDTMENVYSIANIPVDQQVLVHRDVVSVLIGKYELSHFESLLKSAYGLSDNISTVIMNFLKSRVFEPAQLDIKSARVIYLQAEKEGVAGFKNKNILEERSIPNPSPDKLVSYIQELANSIKEKPEPQPKPEPVEEAIKEVRSETKIIEESPTEEINDEKEKEEAIKPVEEKKESILLQAMRQHQVGSEGKLNEYYKALKDNLDFKSEEKENVFQPPFKAVKGRGALVESTGDEGTGSAFAQDITKGNEPEISKNSEFKEPVKYNSFNYLKKEKVASDDPKADTKFIDLGDFE